MKIIGSGVDVTTLKLIGGGTSNKHYFAIGAPTATVLDYLEVADLTINCNLGALSASQIAAGAVRATGSYIRLRSLEVTNWGTKTSGPSCFVLALVTADPAGGVTSTTAPGMEDCIAIDPDAANAGPVSIFHAGPSSDAGTNNEGYGVGPFIRNCFADCGSPTATPEYRGLSMAWCKAGVVEGNQIHNTKYGGPYISKSSTRDLVVRSNWYKNVVKGPFWDLGTLSPTALSSLARDTTFDPTGKTAVAQTSSNHGMLPGDRVKIALSAGPAQYAGIFVILDPLPALNKFRYLMTSDPGAGAVTSPTWQKIFGVGKLVVEGNTIELATGSTGLIGIHLNDASLTPQPPDYAHGDILIRDNRIRYLDGLFASTYTGYALQLNGAKNLLVRNNVVEVYPTDPLKNDRCGSVAYFNNKTPAGTLIRGLNQVNSTKYDELETDAEDAFILGLLKKN
jgi:hypothetical protein